MKKIIACRFRRISMIAPAIVLGIAIFALPTRQVSAGGISFSVDAGNASFGVGIGDGGSQFYIGTNQGSASIEFAEPLPILGTRFVQPAPRPAQPRRLSPPKRPQRLEPPAPTPRADVYPRRGMRPDPAPKTRFSEPNRRPAPNARRVGPDPRRFGTAPTPQRTAVPGGPRTPFDGPRL